MRLNTILCSAAILGIASLASPALADGDKAGDKAELEADTVTDLDGAVLDSVVYFDFDKTELSDKARAALDRAAAWMADNPGVPVVIEGHTDKVGDLAYNRKLADARAEATRRYLVDAGVSPARIRVMPYGESMPIVPTDKSARANRRIRIYSVHNDPVVKTEVKVVEEPVPAYIPIERTVVKEVPKLVPLKYAVSAGAGVIQSLDGDTRDVTDVGGTWNLRFTAATRALLGGEIAYVGSAQPIDDRMGLGSDATLLANGAEGAFRIGLPNHDLQPYAFAGVGMVHYSLVDANADLDDNVVFFPAGIGLAYRIKGVYLDVRGTARAAFDDDIFDRMVTSTGETRVDTTIFDPALVGERGLENWSASAQLGVEF